MSLSSLMSMSDEHLRAEHRRRIRVGLIALACALIAAYTGASFLLDTADGPRVFAKLVFLLAAQAAVGLAIVFWMTRPMQERDRRKRLIMRQAIGAFPEMDD